MRIQFPIYLFPLFIMACQSEQSAKTEKEEKQSNPEIVEGSEDFDFPEVDSLTNFPHSEFVLTLDEDLPKDKNVVYASTIALCWEGMKNRFNNKIDGIDKSSLLFRLDQFNKFKNTLAANEYKVNIEKILTKIPRLSTPNSQKHSPFQNRLPDLQNQWFFKVKM